MSKNETGEFELVLGNKQLLSVFFIVVILLGVFFTMGYIVGRNSSPPPLETASGRKGAAVAPEKGSPLIVDSPTAPPPSQIPTATETKPAEETKPSTEPPPAPVQEEKPKPAEKEKPKEKEKEKAKAPEPAPASAPGAGAAPQKGQHYLQVQALPTEQASLVAEVMRKKGFAVLTEVVPNKPALTRILVGPVSPEASSDMKDKLESAGFKGKQAILRKF